MVLEGAPSSVQKGAKHPLGLRGQVLGTGSVRPEAWTHRLLPWPEKGPVPHTGTVLESAGRTSITGPSWAPWEQAPGMEVGSRGGQGPGLTLSSRGPTAVWDLAHRRPGLQ